MAKQNLKEFRTVSESIPDELAAEFEPYETIDPNGHPYEAVPVFVGFPENYLTRSIMNTERVASNGSKWRIQQLNPRRHKDGPGGSYSVLYCRVSH